MLTMYFRLQFQRAAKLKGAEDEDEEEEEDDDDALMAEAVPEASEHSLSVAELGRLLRELRWMFVVEGPVTQMLYEQIAVRIDK